MWGYQDGSGWWMLFGGMGMLLFWGAVIWFGAIMFRSVTERTPSTAVQALDDPEQIIRRRFASGELNEEEFRRAVDALHKREHNS